MRVLVSGGAGFIGSHVARVLVGAGHEVTILDNLSTGRRELVPRGATFIRGDLKQEKRLDGWLAGHDAVIHLAALVPVAVSVERPRRLRREQRRQHGAVAGGDAPDGGGSHRLFLVGDGLRRAEAAAPERGGAARRAG